jgi:hypothetical protein
VTTRNFLNMAESEPPALSVSRPSEDHALLDELRKWLAKITPGEWRVDPHPEANDDWWGTAAPLALVVDSEGMPICATNDDGIATVQEVQT